MLINVSELISTPLKTENYEVPVDMEFYIYQGDRFPFIKKGSLFLTISNIGVRKIHLEGHWEGSLKVPCDRCLKDVTVPFEVELSKDVDMSAEGGEEAEDHYIEENCINTDTLLNHEILIRFPMKVLCRQDCRGICLKCGKDLNLGECGCDRRSLDPRMAAIQDIFKNFKEV